jgi:hypothetical protein
MNFARQILRDLVRIAPIVSILAAPAIARGQPELRRVLSRLLAPPTIQVEAGFKARLLVPPGLLYDPLFMIPRPNGVVWLNDDGGEENESGSRIMAVTREGKVSVVVGLGKLLPVTGVGIAPSGFGKYAGMLVTIAQPRVGAEGAVENHVIQTIDPQSGKATTVCTLPAGGTAGKGISGYGVQGTFGPPGGPFANRYFAVTSLNAAIYEFTSAGECKPFADLSSYGATFGFTFTPDGSTMLVGAASFVAGPPKPGSGIIVRVSPTGQIDSHPFARGFTAPTGMAFAPNGFGKYANDLFVADAGDYQIPVPMTQALKHDGIIYRVPSDGSLHKVATGFINPIGVTFVDSHTLWITDINGDFIAGKRELPDGFIVALVPN